VKKKKQQQNNHYFKFQEFPLIPSENKNIVLTSPAIVPLRGIDCEHLSLEIYVEEGNKDDDPDLFTPSPLI